MAPKGGIRKRVASSSPESPSPEQSAGASSSRPSPIRGGVRQRIGQAIADDPDVPADLPMNDYLKKQWALGQMSSPQVQAIAERAQQQGATGAERLAAAGTSGRNPQNLQRSLVNFFGIPRGAPPFVWKQIPLKSGSVSHPFLLPHMFFQALHSEHRAVWEKTLRGDPGKASPFWQAIQGTPFVQQHPHLPKRHWGKTIPLGFHGDGGAFSKQDSLFTFSWNSLLGEGCTIDKRFVYTVVKKSDVIPETLPALLKLFSWSANALLTGISPELDEDGQPCPGGGKYLADGWRGALCQIRGDWQFYVELFGFPAWNSSVSMCWLCCASSTIPELSWSDFSDGAAWKATRKTHESFQAERAAEGKPMPVLLSDVVGLRLENIMVDVLHCVDQGVGSHVIGNIFWELAKERAWGKRNIKANLLELEEELKCYYRETKESCKLQGKLTKERLVGKKSWPKLKAKAAQTRKLAPLAFALAIKFDDGSRHSRLRIAVAQLLSRFYELLSTEDMFLSAAARAEMPELGRNLCKLYSQLSTEAFNDGVKGWKVTPKHHIFMHLTEWQAVETGNPKGYWCYADEDLVGTMIEVAESCHPRSMALMALYKWLVVAFDGE